MKLIGVARLLSLGLLCACSSAPDGIDAAEPGGAGGQSDAGSSGTGGAAGANAGWGGGGAGGSTGGAAGTGLPGGAAGNGGSDDEARRLCVPDCYWDLLSPCRPSGECFKEKRGDVFIECSADGTWSAEHDPSKQFGETTTWKNGSVCFQIDFVDNELHYYDPLGRRHAVIRREPDGNWIACEDAPDDWLQFRLYDDDADCVQYEAPECTDVPEGTCE